MSNIVRAILVGGGLCAFLDGVSVTVLYGLRGVPAVRIWQSVASSVLGPSSFQHGWASGVLGLVLHCAVAFTVAAIFVGAASRFPSLRKHQIISGITFGLLVFAVMTFVVVPLSRTAKHGYVLSTLVTQIIMHVCLVGLPIAISTRRVLGS
jgi:hypothetical protein